MSRRRLIVVVLAALVALAACELNPQPLPPRDDLSAPEGSGFDGGTARADAGGFGSTDGGVTPAAEAGRDGSDAAGASDAADGGDAADGD